VFQVGEDCWIFDGPEVRFMTLDIPTRMTIVRVESGLWVHSPIPLTPDIRKFVSNHGGVSKVIAPNNLHHLYLDGWLKEYPDADYTAVPSLIDKRKDLKFTNKLQPGKVFSWSDEIDHSHFHGNRYVEEVVFFHRKSKALILTDLVLNLKTDGYSLWQKMLARFDGVAYPDGMSPRFLRWNMRDRKAALICYETILSWAPEKVIISHGECMFENGTEEVKKRLGWIAAKSK